MSIEKLDLLSPSRVMLAPMVGLTHFAVREAVASFLPPGQKALWPTEMLNSRRIPSQHMNESPETNFMDVANGLCPQLLANEEEFIRLSVPRLEKWGAVAIDINMGCPVKRALKHNYGVALMGDPDYAAEVVRMTTKHATVPVSVKLRAGSKRLLDRTLPDDFGYLYEFIDGLFEAGASWITLHPRMAEQGRRGSADWGLIRKLKARFHSQGKTRVIIGNGDIQCHEDIQEMFDVSDCDRAMIGRALIVKPWLMRNEPEPDAYAQGELYGKFLMRVLDNMIAHYEVSAGLRRMKFLVVSGKAWVEYGEFLYGRTMAARTYEELKTSYEKFFSSRQKIVKRTELRS